MIIVADSSPVIALVNIQLIDLLPSLFGNVLIPQQIADELIAPKRPSAVRSFMATQPTWLQIRAPRSIEHLVGLQAGESAAISLARELGADRLIVDEMDGRRIATEMGIRVIGTVGVLEVAAERRLIELEASFEKLKATDFWLPVGFLDQRLALYRQRFPT